MTIDELVRRARAEQWQLLRIRDVVEREGVAAPGAASDYEHDVL